VSATPATPVAVPMPEADPDATAGLDGPCVLLAEDNLFNQKVASGMLRLLGCRVTLAANGSQALAMVQGGDFDLVFMDCQMPEMDGYEATRRIRALPGDIARIPIVAITANAFHGDREACEAAGMNDYLTKPVNKDQFDRMLATWGSQISVGVP
jgi:CheY-like chemotaxis protein